MVAISTRDDWFVTFRLEKKWHVGFSPFLLRKNERKVILVRCIRCARIMLYTILKHGAFLFGIDCMNYVMLKFTNTTFKHPNEISNRLTCIVCYVSILFRCVTGMRDYLFHAAPLELTLQEVLYRLTAFFLYDLMMLCSTARGRKQWVFFTHHVLALGLIALRLYYHDGAASAPLTILSIFLLEFASPGLNVTKILEEASPRSSLTKFVRRLTMVTYAVTRLQLLPLMLAWYLYNHRTSTTLMISAGFSILIAASYAWFQTMRKKWT